MTSLHPLLQTTSEILGKTNIHVSSYSSLKFAWPKQTRGRQPFAEPGVYLSALRPQERSLYLPSWHQILSSRTNSYVSPLSGQAIVTYLEDRLIYRPDIATHARILEQVHVTFRRHYSNPKFLMCNFATSGHGTRYSSTARYGYLHYANTLISRRCQLLSYVYGPCLLRRSPITRISTPQGRCSGKCCTLKPSNTVSSIKSITSLCVSPAR